MSTKYFVILILLVVAALAGYQLFSRPSVTPPSATNPPDPNVFMPNFAAKAVLSAAERGVTLDYSPGSVKLVEKVLGQLHDERAKGMLDDNAVNTAALHYGGYIGEVLHRKYGGSWATDHKVAGPSTFPFTWNGGDSFPVGWCGKRILNGDEDNVWFKYQVLTKRDLQTVIGAPPASGPTTRTD